jgi:hypothetical protein
MDFLKKYNISDEDINIISNNNYSNIINVIILNKNNVCEIIDYLLSIGIEVDTLAQMLSDRLDLFIKPVSEIKDSFERFNVENLVTIINDDIVNLKFV